MVVHLLNRTLPWLFSPLRLITASVGSSKGDISISTPAVHDEHLVAASVDERMLAALLTHYEKPGMAPPSARMRAVVLHEQRGRYFGDIFLFGRAMRVGTALASKATELALEAVIHHLWGPRKKSWGLRMTLLSSAMRDAHRHTGLVDIATIRLFLSLSNLAPLPAGARVEPFIFRVARRELRGILAEPDSQEAGTRELAGEWVDARVSPPEDNDNGRIIMFLHGGAYYLFSPATHRGITAPLSRVTNARVFAVDYRLAPETRFPGPLHDAVSAYFRLIDELGVSPERIIVSGDSAGGGLTLAMLMYLRDNGYPLPAGAILMSPWVDLTLSCDSWERNAPFDIVPRPIPGDALDPISCYLGREHMDTLLTHPYASPLFGAFDGLPPILLQTGEVEVLRDEADLLAHKARRAGVRVVHEVYQDAVHVFHAFSFLEASQKAFVACGSFAREIIPDIVPPVMDEKDTHRPRKAKFIHDRKTWPLYSGNPACLTSDEAGFGSGCRQHRCVRKSSDSFLRAASATTASGSSNCRSRARSHSDVTSLWALAVSSRSATSAAMASGRPLHSLTSTYALRA